MGNIRLPLSLFSLFSYFFSISSDGTYCRLFFFLKDRIFVNDSRKKKNSFLIKLQIALSYFKGDGQLERLIKGTISPRRGSWAWLAGLSLRGCDHWTAGRSRANSAFHLPAPQLASCRRPAEDTSG